MHLSALANQTALPQRSLFLYSPVGGGHIHASRSVEAAWQARQPAWTADQIDYLQFLGPLERRFWPSLYLTSLRVCPSLWRSYRRWTNRPDEPRFIRERVTDVGGDAFAEVLRRARPRLVVSTIGGAAALAGAARARLGAGAGFVNALVVSGFRAHRHWARPEADLFFVSCHEAKADLVAHRIPADRIFVVGIPIDPRVRPLAAAEKRSLRARLGLGDGPVLLISSGATGAYRAMDRLLDALARLDRPLEVVTFKGPAAGVVQKGQMRLHRLGFRNDFVDWLSASDLVVGKLGGHTAAEALAAGVPMVVYEPIAGQEEDNAAWVEAAGAAVWPRTLPALVRTVTDLLDDDRRREQLAHGARRLGRPDAAASIARILAAAVEARP
jgi:processive 1,2-diacylglycerol beta-glucosyltransferase